jgi:hypothetical protein
VVSGEPTVALGTDFVPTRMGVSLARM